MRAVTFTSQPDFRAHPLRATFRRIIWRLHWQFRPQQPLVVHNWWRGMEILLPKSGSAAQIFYRTLSSPRTAGALTQVVHEGMIVIDVGAHVGEYSLIAAKLVGEPGMVHAFEPQPTLVPLIRRNAARNGLANIKIHTYAVADQTGTTPFRSDPQSMGGWMATGADATIDVPCTTLDQFALQNDLRHVDVIKLDAGGNELAALRGARTVLATHDPVVITKLYHPEVTAARFGYDVRMIAETLWQAGYDVSVLEGANHPGEAPASTWGEIRSLFDGTTYCLTSLAVKRSHRGSSRFC